MDADVPVIYPPNPNPKPPKMKMPAGAWDCHFHVVGPPNRFPYVHVREYLPPACPVEHYLAVAKILGFERGVVVQPTIHGFDPAVTLDAIKKSGGRLKGMIRPSPTLEKDEVKRLHDAGIRGMRVELRKLGAGFDEAKFKRLIDLAAQASWVVALHVEPDTIIRFADVIRRLPVQTVIENYALMDARNGVDQPAVRALIDLAQEPHIWLKTASAYRMLRKGATYEQVVPIAKRLHAATPERCIWGTDWPHPGVLEPGKMQVDEDLIDMLPDFIPDEINRRKLLVDNPKRLFDF
jgi:predicted TIM-barrel fold metal-dependent hydrolase